MEDPRQTIDRYLAGEPSTVQRVDGWIRAAAGSFRLRLAADWDDAVQDARLEVTRLLRSGQFRGESALATYIWRVTVRHCVHVSRRRLARASRESELTPAASVAEPAQLEAVLSAERQRAFAAILEAMPAECLEIWRMVVRGIGYREIAEKLGVGEGALRVRALRCRRRASELRNQAGTRESR